MSIRFDCDSHFLPKKVFDDVDFRFEPRRPRLYFKTAGQSVLSYPEREVNLSSHHRYIQPSAFGVSRREPGFREPEIRIGLLDRLGIDIQVLVSANDPFHYDVEPDFATSVCQSHNNAISTVLRKYIVRFDSSSW